MKIRHKTLLAAFVTLTIAGLASVYLTPPAHWDKIKIGMSAAEVSAIIPEFDQPWDGIKADFEYEKRLGFTWRLAVGRSPTGVDLVEKELWITWPEMRRLWHSTKT
jgi:hypothetical protein